ncbi:ATPase, T2SS/T4P/T4SS family [bacterium]
MENNQVIVIAGPKEGVGKTTFTASFAVQYALQTKKQVVILDCDSECRGDVSFYLPNTVYETVEDLWKVIGKVKTEGIDASLFKGRIAFSPQGIGVIRLAENIEKAESIEPAHIIKLITIFSNLYTFIVDVERLNHEFRTALFDRADYVFWLMLPQIIQVKNTAEEFERLQNLHFNMEKFGIILNQSDVPEGMSLRQINPQLQAAGRSVLQSIPQEKMVMRAMNARQTVVIDQPHTQFAKIVRDMVDSLSTRAGKVGAQEAAGGKIWKDILSKVKELQVSEGEGVTETAQTKEQIRNSIKARVHKQMVQELNNRKIDLNAGQDDPKRQNELFNIVEQTALRILGSLGDTGFSRQENQDIVREIMDDSLGLGPLEELLRDKSITEIMVNKKDQIYVEQKGRLTLVDKKFNTDDQVVQVIRRIIAPLGRRVDESVPFVDARLKDGSRVNAIIAPLSVQGPMITIRRFPEKALTPEEMISYGSITDDIVQFLRGCVIAEKNMIVSGGTGSGKTTLLNMLSSFIPETERIITVEDVAELRLQQDHIGRLESRPPNIEGKGEITIRDLVKNTLRMRPDRIVVGECRGGESLDMLQAMNTGHDGSMTTIHANNPVDMVARLEAMVLMSGAELPIRVIRGYIASAVHYIVQIARLQDGSRKVLSVSELTGMDEQSMKIGIEHVFVYKRTGVDADGKVLGHYEPTGYIPSCVEEFKLRGIELNMDIFKKKK